MQDVIYTSRAYATMSVSVRLSVMFVHCGHRVQWIPDTFACLDRWMSATYWQHLTRIVGWDDTGISGGRDEGSSRAILATASPSCFLIIVETK